MTTTTIDRINQLSAERSKLYRMARNGHLGNPDLRRRTDEITRELEILWERRRQERAGRREGIDLLVARAYERLYGSDFDDPVAPLRVGSTEDEAATLAA
jgi:hypothetical protein